MRNNIKAPTPNESRMIKFMILLGVFSILNFLVFFFKPEHRTNSLLFFMLSSIILYGVLKKLYMWYNYSNISVPKTPEVTPNLTVDVLTTYFPGEPYKMITTTLKAIKNIKYPHTTYLCDEADDPFLKQFCEENGIVHVTRDNRIDAKAGNINNALKKHATGDICVILDPDHIPEPEFLDPILPHFSDPKIGFVQIVQSYYNIKESLVARGAAEQTFQFYGPMMMTLNAYGAVNAIGANCVFRREALDSIGGHAPGLCEDMHTAMLLYAKGWKAVYVPIVLAKGLAPSNLTNFFKQQLKWSRGSFDLWVKVFPKIFSKLTGRQRIHYGILPMHYLSGVIILFTFLIPILSLLLSTTPWKGNIIDFVLVLLPVAASSILIRTFIQKWVIEKKERGFHLVGGLLHINTWWIYILGLVYTILNKKVPYLPTPKEDEFNTNMKIILPNAIVALVSIFAIVFGLYQDLTPFSIVMSGFAFFNALIMMFGIYIAVRVTNQNKILRTRLHKKSLSVLASFKHGFYRLANLAFEGTRTVALPLLLLILITSMSFKNEHDQLKWDEVYVPFSKKHSGKYLGIFQPSEGNGISDIQAINELESRENIDFDIISFYLAWTDESVNKFPHQLMDSIYQKNAIPMITWEPWASTLASNDTVRDLSEEKKVFKHIIDGYFDDYIIKFANILKTYDKPIFLRFAHEFDNPQYPWSQAGNNTSEELKAAWIYVHKLMKKEGAHKAIFVWNPWKPKGMNNYYPGDQYVDWIGLTMLNYGPLNENGEVLPFNKLYEPFKNKLYWFTRKPIMLAEFGSLKLGQNNQESWLTNAVDSINSSHENIKALVFFNSSVDENIPKNKWLKDGKLDWTINSWDSFKQEFSGEAAQGSEKELKKVSLPEERNPISRFDIRGVRYKKGTNWMNNYYAVTKEVISKDFENLKSSGINTIQITGGNIYDHNLLLYSEKFDLQLIYQFNIDQSLDFINDTAEKEELKQEILNKVEKLKDLDHVISYSFLLDLEQHYQKPLLFNQRTAYLNWLQDLTQRIKQISPEKSITVDLQLNSDTEFLIDQIHEHLPVDSYGLIVKDTTFLENQIKEMKGLGRDVFISSITPNLIVENSERFVNQDLILQNWQDERKSNWINFDGLVDFRGRKKQILKDITAIWNEKKVPEKSLFRSRILKPAEQLYPGQIYRYHAAQFDGKEWIVQNSNKEYKFEWNLIKTDRFGNHLAIKKLGSQPEVEVIIPEDYKQYEIMLVTRKKGEDYVTSTRTSLHTPAEN